jgi:Ca2+-binding EF-hand superfamily protein
VLLCVTHEVFQSFDRDKSGSIDRDELDQAMEMMGMDIKPSELDLMIAQVDTGRVGPFVTSLLLSVLCHGLSL